VLHFKINPSINADQILNLGLIQAYQSSATGVITPLSSGASTLTAINNFVGIKELANNRNIIITPNPTNGTLNITSKTELQKIEVTSITGQVLLSEVAKNNNHILNLENYSNGIYFINVYESNLIIKREKIIIKN
jgi:hypothetical protein